MNITITGSRRINPVGVQLLKDWLGGVNKDATLITGACIGVDAWAAQIGHDLHLKVHTVVPGPKGLLDPLWQTRCSSHELMPDDSTYRDRNIRLVELADEVYAFPERPEDRSPWSGTWQTIRLTYKAGKPVWIFVLSGRTAT